MDKTEIVAKNPRHITEIIFIGTFFVTFSLIFIQLLGILALHSAYATIRIIICACLLSYLFVTFILIKYKLFTAVAWMLIGLYGIIGSIILVIWSINAPVGILILGFVIFLSSVMLGSRFIIPVTLGIICLLVLVQSLNSLNMIHSDRTPLTTDPGFSDVISYGTIFGVFALISWVSGRQMEQSLQKTKDAEIALAKEKGLLASRLEERTLSLRESQFKEMRQLYRFAELGQLTTVILHELANNLSVLTLDIDDLKQRHRQSATVTRAQESISYIESLVDQARQQLQEDSRSVRFNIINVIKNTIKSSGGRATKAKVTLIFHNPDKLRSVYITADPLRLSQIITILINNAIDAYDHLAPSQNSTVTIMAYLKYHNVLISTIDKGVGIPAQVRKDLFTPSKSSKEHGLGIGLFIARQIIETHFKGTLSISSELRQTEFVIKLPIK